MLKLKMTILFLLFCMVFTACADNNEIQSRSLETTSLPAISPHNYHVQKVNNTVGVKQTLKLTLFDQPNQTFVPVIKNGKLVFTFNGTSKAIPAFETSDIVRAIHSLKFMDLTQNGALDLIVIVQTSNPYAKYQANVYFQTENQFIRMGWFNRWVNQKISKDINLIAKRIRELPIEFRSSSSKRSFGDFVCEQGGAIEMMATLDSAVQLSYQIIAWFDYDSRASYISFYETVSECGYQQTLNLLSEQQKNRLNGYKKHMDKLMSNYIDLGWNFTGGGQMWADEQANQDLSIKYHLHLYILKKLQMKKPIHLKTEVAAAATRHFSQLEKRIQDVKSEEWRTASDIQEMRETMADSKKEWQALWSYTQTDPYSWDLLYWSLKAFI